MKDYKKDKKIAYIYLTHTNARKFLNYIEKDNLI